MKVTGYSIKEFYGKEGYHIYQHWTSGSWLSKSTHTTLIGVEDSYTDARRFINKYVDIVNSGKVKSIQHFDSDGSLNIGW